MENLDYEMFYDHIQAHGTEQEKKDLNAAIRSAFKEMDDSIRTYRDKLLASSCCRFISRIVEAEGTSFIFTLNQDMFFERFQRSDKNTVVPGLPNHLTHFKDVAIEDSSNFSLRLPTADELEPRKELFRKDFAQIAYVKLHAMPACQIRRAMISHIRAARSSKQ